MIDKKENLLGRRFNHLTVIAEAESVNGFTAWLCKCDCGNEKVIRAFHLKRGQKSCGCKTKEILRKCRTTHGYSHTKLYDIWHRMKERCFCKNHKSYKDYGGRGITVCDEWMKYENFHEWAMSSGYNPNADFMKCTIDRIDPNGNYSPDNCRWVDMKTQCNNRTNNVRLEYDGVTHTLSEWADITGISRDTINRRLTHGWDVKTALWKPVSVQKNNRSRNHE